MAELAGVELSQFESGNEILNYLQSHVNIRGKKD